MWLRETAGGYECLLAESERDEIPTLLDFDDVDDVEMLLSPKFIQTMSRFAKVVAETDFNPDRAHAAEPTL